MVREAIISVATLAGLVGLATYYTGSTASTESRVARAVDDFGELDFDANESNDAVFAEDFNMDVSMFQDDNTDAAERAGGAKQQISQVKNCLKNAGCTDRAQNAVKTWSANAVQYISSNPSRLLKPVNAGYEDTENDFGFCTPNDDAIPCSGASADPLASYNANSNSNSKGQLSANSDVQALIDSYSGKSSSLDDAMESMTATGPQDNTNAFRKRAAKVFVVIPNGVPVSMPDSYAFRFGNYWRWFKQFNQKYIGIGVNEGANRINMHMWFLRQDKNLKLIMRTPAKTSQKFPWRRFDSVMLPNQNTAAQPKLAGTFQALWEQIDAKGMSSDSTEGQDCFTLWFHQYIPADILDLSDSLFQEETMANLEKACTLIHIWVGMGALADDTNTIKTVQYLQGLMQPEQMVSTSADPQLRRFYFIDDLEALGADAGNHLMDQIYNDIAFERSRATCLLAAEGNDLGAVFERNNERYDEYYAYGEDATTTNAYGVATSAMTGDAYGVTYDAETNDYETSSVSYDDSTTAGEPGVPDYKCCGIGFAGQKYDSNAQACCEDGSIQNSEADCFL